MRLPRHPKCEAGPGAAARRVDGQTRIELRSPCKTPRPRAWATAGSTGHGSLARKRPGTAAAAAAAAPPGRGRVESPRGPRTPSADSSLSCSPLGSARASVCCGPRSRLLPGPSPRPLRHGLGRGFRGRLRGAAPLRLRDRGQFLQECQAGNAEGLGTGHVAGKDRDSLPLCVACRGLLLSEPAAFGARRWAGQPGPPATRPPQAPRGSWSRPRPSRPASPVAPVGPSPGQRARPRPAPTPGTGPAHRGHRGTPPSCTGRWPTTGEPRAEPSNTRAPRRTAASPTPRCRRARRRKPRRAGGCQRHRVPPGTGSARSHGRRHEGLLHPALPRGR
jgi:hypothetical protein